MKTRSVIWSRAARLLLLIIALASLGAFLFFTTDPQLDQVLEAPGWRHWMGTDPLGRDLLLRILDGNVFSWLIGLLAGCLAFAIGSFVGFVAGWSRGKVDFALMRVIEILDSIPSVVLVTLLVVLLRSYTQDQVAMRVLVLSVGIGLTHWMSFARLSRVLVLQESQSAFVEGAVAIGASRTRIFWVHLRPHLLPVMRQSFWAHLPSFFLFESLLSFLGFGLQSPAVSLGVLLQEGWKSLSVAPHLLLAPGLLLFVTLLCFQIGFEKEPRPSAL